MKQYPFLSFISLACLFFLHAAFVIMYIIYLTVCRKALVKLVCYTFICLRVEPTVCLTQSRLYWSNLTGKLFSVHHSII